MNRYAAVRSHTAGREPKWQSSSLAHAAVINPPASELEPETSRVPAPDFSRYLSGDRDRAPGAVSKGEAAAGTRDDDKGGRALRGGLIGLFAGAVAGGIIGGLIGGPIGMLIGMGVGALAGGLLGAGIGAATAGGGSTAPAAGGTGTAAPAPAPAPAAGTASISWDAANVTEDAAAANPTTVNRPFVPVYGAEHDTSAQVWKLKVDSITGGVDIAMHTGGYRNPLTSPPTNEAEAQDAVTKMKAYYNNGRQSWHTPAASRAHEDFHYREWKCSSEHYWPAARTAIQNLTVPDSGIANDAAAITALRTGAGKADAIMAGFTKAAHDYWFMLSDTAPSRPYAAGQLVLNAAITNVQALAATNSWTVPAGVDTPSSEPPCYEVFPPWAP